MSYENAYEWQYPATVSNQIDAFAWDAANDRMMIRFKQFNPEKPMPVYGYPNADQNELKALLESKSVGSAFGIWKHGESAKGFVRLPDEKKEPDKP
jgi:hypothetical protein